MRRCKLTLLGLLALGSAAGCPTKPGADLSGFDCDSKTRICVPRDGGTSNPDGAGGGSGSGGVGGAGGVGGVGGITIQITNPTSPAYTNGSVSIQVEFLPASAAPAQADLYDGSTKIATLAPPFNLTWNTSSPTAAAEGPHEITARATIAGQTITSAPVTIYVDRTPPEVTGRAPAAGATQVLFADRMQIVFSEAIAPATLTGAVTLSTGSGNLASTTTLGTDGKTVTITLSDRRAIALPADVTVSLKSTIADLAGNAIGSTPTWSWTAPLWVKFPKLAGQFPDLVLDRDDRPVILNAVDQGANDFVLQLARLGPTRIWDTTIPSPQSARPTFQVSQGGTLTLGTDGLPIVAWAERQGSIPATIRIARWTGSAWGNPYGQLAGFPSFGSPPGADLWAAWAAPNPSLALPTVFVGRWDGTSWDLKYGNVGVSGAERHVLRFGLDGQPVVAYAIAVAQTSGVSRWTGSSWSTLPTYRNYRDNPTLAIDASDRPVVVSPSGQAADQYLPLYIWNQSVNAWVEEIPAIPTGLQPGQPQLIIPADGHPVVAWTDFDANSGARVVRVARHTGVQWDFAYGVLSGFTGANSDGGTPRIVLDRGGSPIVAWQETDGTVQSTYVWRSNH